MRIIFRTEYIWGLARDASFTFEDPRVKDWLNAHGLDWSCIGITVRPFDAFEGWSVPPETAIDLWADIEDPSLATLFKLRWC